MGPPANSPSPPGSGDAAVASPKSAVGSGNGDELEASAVQNAIEADDTADDHVDDSASDAAYESDMNSTGSTSVSSSVRDYVFENNRRYHKFQEGRYLLPNDDAEQEREDMKHAMCVSLCSGKLHMCPLENPQKILDLGTGTGIWCIDMGDEYPGAEVIGLDLSPIQPSWVPPNVRFMIDDVETEWVDPPNSLDYVHGRHICMTIKNFPRLAAQAYTALKPGGWIELQELRFKIFCDDGSAPEGEGYGYTKFINLAMAGFRSFGFDPLVMENNKNMLIDAGFVNVEEKIWKVPIGAWPKDRTMKTIGIYNRSLIMDGLHSVGIKPITKGLGWSEQEVELLLVDVRKALMDASNHVYYTFHAVYGQKPGGS
ncbi:methyltransferase domain-containing protein [Podospora didyma]|uniref:Methyltransferase domain-containing protein n=1 Tax=Podospora didyma TaxID=330526 RepID=A0AAE0TVJ5_9PEZI|nr:methyltransferase domain-containing protein [Podospora didyma]